MKLTRACVHAAGINEAGHCFFQVADQPPWQQSRFTSSQQTSPEPQIQPGGGGTYNRRQPSEGSVGRHMSDGSAGEPGGLPIYSQVKKGPNYPPADMRREAPSVAPKPNNYPPQRQDGHQPYNMYGQQAMQPPWQQTEEPSAEQDSRYPTRYRQSPATRDLPEFSPPTDSVMPPQEEPNTTPADTVAYEDVAHNTDPTPYYTVTAEGYGGQYPAGATSLSYPDNSQHQGIPDTHGWGQHEDQGQSQLAAQENYNPEEDQWSASIVEIILQRNRQGYGFSIRGGQEYRNSPLYVLRIAEGGAAAIDGRLQVSG